MPAAAKELEPVQGTSLGLGYPTVAGRRGIGHRLPNKPGTFIIVPAVPSGPITPRLRWPPLPSSKTYVNETHNSITPTGPQSILAVQDDKVCVPLLQKSILGAMEAIVDELAGSAAYYWQWGENNNILTI
jgi:hypothetical protein